MLNKNSYKMLIIYNNMFSEKNKNYRLNNNEVKKLNKKIMTSKIKVLI